MGQNELLVFKLSGFLPRALLDRHFLPFRT